MGRGPAHAPQPPWRNPEGEKGRAIGAPMSAQAPDRTFSPSAVPCTVRFVAQTTRSRGDSPRTSGGRVCLAAVSFLSPFGWPSWAWGWRGSRFQAGARVLDRTGTDKGWYSRHSQPQGRQFGTVGLGGSFGAGPRQVFRANGSTALICRRTEPLWATRLATGK